MNRAPDTRLSEALMRLNRTQRAALVKAVGGRFLREAATTGVATASAPEVAARYEVKDAPVGEVIKDGRGNPAFEKTDAGWKSVVKVPLERILMLVKEANREPVGKLLKDAGEGEDLTILLGFLADPDDANTDRGLRLKKVDGMFMDPVSLSDKKIEEIAKLLKYQPPVKKKDDEAKTAKVELGPDDRIFNNIIFKYDADKSLLKVIVDLDKGGTAQLKRLLGTDAAVSKADEEIAKAPTSGETKITLDPPAKGSTLFSLTEKPVKLKASAFRYLPVKKLLVLDVPNVDQTQWEALAQKLEVGKKGEPGSVGLTVSDLRSMKTNQVVIGKDGKKFGFKIYANEMGLFGPEYVISKNETNSYRFTNKDGKVIPRDGISSLKDKDLVIARPTTITGASNGPQIRARYYNGELQMIYTYEEFIQTASNAQAQNLTIAYPEEKI